MIGQAIAILQQAGYDFTARELADIFWLAVHMEPSSKQSPHQITEPSPQLPTPKPDSSKKPVDTSKPEVSEPPVIPNKEPTAPVVLPPPPVQNTDNTEVIPIKIPAAAALRNSLALGRALRPLMRKVPSSTENILDEEATVQRFAEDEIGIPVLKSTPERWLELALVVEETSITGIWKQTIREFEQLLKYHGAFRDVRAWKLKASESITQTSMPTKIQLFAENSTGFDELTPHKPDVLIDSKGRRLILLLSDCISPIWRKQLIHPILELWGKCGLITILQLLPERFWERTALVDEIPVLLSASKPGVYNSQLTAQLWDEDDIDEFADEHKSEILKSLTSIPLITLEPEALLIWSQVITGQGNISTAGFKFYSHQETKTTTQSPLPTPQLSAPDLVNLFRANASLQARRLAGLMAAVPVSISIVHQIQQTLLPESTQIHVAEVFISGLLKRLPISHQDDTDYIAYEFVDGVRELLRDFVPPDKQISVIDKISEFLAKRLGLSVQEFDAQILKYDGNDAIESKIRPFARLKAQVLRQLGGDYALEAEKLDFSQFFAEFPQFQAFEFKVKTITIEDDNLQSFEFKVVLIEVNQSVQTSTMSLLEIVNEAVLTKTEKPLTDVEQLVIQGVLANQTYEQIAASAGDSVEYLLPVMTRTNLWKYLRNNVAPNLWKLLSTVFGEKVTKRNVKKVIEQFAASRHLTIHRHRHQSQYFIEDLGNDVLLEMVVIPEGSFIMGSPTDEPGQSEDESPQHTVTIKPFFLGKYPVTQAQWQAVAALPQVNRELNPDPSIFKGENRPVESVSWYDTVEFCDRLSRQTGKPYRLPSEAEWEYACRAGTTTPFHFGETITSELANYDANYTYGAGVKGIYRQETTVVGIFEVANAFGLYDMHGNVWEWCADHWHGNYEGAPTDGSAWIENDNYNRYWPLRGGSWYNDPDYCRCASRYNGPDFRDLNFGFRVVCAGAVARTL